MTFKSRKSGAILALSGSGGATNEKRVVNKSVLICEKGNKNRVSSCFISVKKRNSLGCAHVGHVPKLKPVWGCKHVCNNSADTVSERQLPPWGAIPACSCKRAVKSITHCKNQIFPLVMVANKRPPLCHSNYFKPAISNRCDLTVTKWHFYTYNWQKASLVQVTRLHEGWDKLWRSVLSLLSQRQESFLCFSQSQQIDRNLYLLCHSSFKYHLREADFSKRNLQHKETPSMARMCQRTNTLLHPRKDKWTVWM